MKVALLLCELDVPFETIAIDIFKGEQHQPVFRALNPNGKVPVLVDGDVTVFDSHAILIYLAEKHARFLPDRPVTLSWLQLIATGLSPFSGQAVHFLHYAPEVLPYAKQRYVDEVVRHYTVLESRLTRSPFLGGRAYGIADMALWGWARGAAYIFGDRGLAAFPHVDALVKHISSRPAAARAATLQTNLGLKTTFDDETRRALFPDLT